MRRRPGRRARPVVSPTSCGRLHRSAQRLHHLSGLGRFRGREEVPCPDGPQFPAQPAQCPPSGGGRRGPGRHGAAPPAPPPRPPRPPPPPRRPPPGGGGPPPGAPAPPPPPRPDALVGQPLQ